MRIRPDCNHDPAVAPVLEIDEAIAVVFGSERAMATAIAATCWPVIFPGASDDWGDGAVGISAGGADVDCRSNRLIPLIEIASNASTANTMPMPTRLKVSPSFSKS